MALPSANPKRKWGSHHPRKGFLGDDEIYILHSRCCEWRFLVEGGRGVTEEETLGLMAFILAVTGAFVAGYAAGVMG